MDRPWFPKLDDKLRKRVGLIGTTVLVFMAAIGILFFGDALGRYSGYWDAQHERHADHYQNETANEINRCFARPEGPPGIQKCVEDAVKTSHENQRDERDLSAQRQMAKWAWWLLIVTAVQAPLTALGLIFLLITIWQGREANAIAQSGNRPIMVFDGFQIRPFGNHNATTANPEAAHALLIPIWKNMGPMPALSLRCQVYRSYAPHRAGQTEIDGLRATGPIVGSHEKKVVAANALYEGPGAIIIGHDVGWQDMGDLVGEHVPRYRGANSSLLIVRLLYQAAIGGGEVWETEQIAAFIPVYKENGSFAQDQWFNVAVHADEALLKMT